MEKKSSIAQEERDLAEALEKIRELEQREQLVIDIDNQVLEYLKQGDLVYELYSVLVHSGSALGGHYYAYIKSFEDGKWYNYNDSDVSEIKPEDISQVFGDKSGRATAYMLKYRRYDPLTRDNPTIISETLIPEYLKEEIDSETNKMIEEQKQIEEKLLNLKVRIWNSQKTIEDGSETYSMKAMSIKKNQTLGELATLAMDNFGIKDISLDNLRFRLFDSRLKVK